MTKFYKVTLPTGATFTRTTANRSYSHMVVAIYRVASERARAEQAARDTWKMNLKYTQECAAGGHRAQVIEASGFHPDHGYSDPVKYAAYVARQHGLDVEQKAHALAKLAHGVEGAVADRLAQFDAAIATSRYNSADGTEFYRDAGWCGRLDLAEKLAATVSNPWIMDTVEITKEEYTALKKAAKAKK